MEEMNKQEITLEKIDLVRERMNISYKEAREALDASNGDLVGALVHLEEKKKGKRTHRVEKQTAAADQWKEEIVARGSDVIDKIKALLAEGNASKIRIRQGDKVILEIPVTLGSAGVILLPQLAAIGAIAALFAQVTIEVERPKKNAEPCADQKCAEKVTEAKMNGVPEEESCTSDCKEEAVSPEAKKPE
ncbi:MAG: DUF4342 domain-containing protein [Negativicutes bacterium]|nr:DUF4342 domain-containing protein [Negativicutes bacterium]